MKNFVISLKKTPDRLKNFLEHNHFLENIEVFEAVDGSLVVDKIEDLRVIFSKDLEYKQGAYGCAMSHKHLWEYAVRNETDVTIFEDDTIIHPSFNEYSIDLINEKNDWDLIFWGFNPDALLIAELMLGIKFQCLLYDRNINAEIINNFNLKKAKSTLLKLHFVTGTPAYSVSVKGAKKLLETIFPLDKFVYNVPGTQWNMDNQGIDCAMSLKYSEMNSYVAFPPLVIVPNDQSITTIQNT